MAVQPGFSILSTMANHVEDEANSYFQRFYNEHPYPTLAVEEVLEVLQKNMASPYKRERDVFCCMIKNLFEEYYFFIQYPGNQFDITAQLFGEIIERGVITNCMVLSLALRFILEALRKPFNTKMYCFGIWALDRFKYRLKEFKKFCELVTNIPHFSKFPPYLIKCVQEVVPVQKPANRPTFKQIATNVHKTRTTTTASDGNTTSASVSRPSIVKPPSIESLLIGIHKATRFTAPQMLLQEKIFSTFKNLNKQNLKCKSDDFRNAVTKEYWPWVARYLVCKLVSIEVISHELYSDFLDNLKIPEFNKIVLSETYRNIKFLLHCDRDTDDPSNRLLLKNLGNWLGLRTLAKNRPILFEEIDLKGLLLEAYHKGETELLYVVPFVAKALESGTKSTVFKLNNAWMKAMIKVFAELLNDPTLKANLQFDILNMCDTLNVNIGQIEPASYLNDPQQLKNLELQMS